MYRKLTNNIRISNDRLPEYREEDNKIFHIITKRNAIDNHATYKRGFFKVRGNLTAWMKPKIYSIPCQ